MNNLYSIHKVTVGQLVSPEEKRELEQLFDEAAQRRQWQVPADFGQYMDQSIQWGLYRGQAMIGGCQLTVDGAKGLPFEQVWPEYTSLKKPGCGEIVNLVMDSPSKETGRTFLVPCIEMFRYCDQHGIDSLFTAITERRRKQYAALGCPFEIVGPQRQHWGFPSHLLRVSIAAIKLAVAELPPAHRKLVRNQWERSP